MRIASLDIFLALFSPIPAIIEPTVREILVSVNVFVWFRTLPAEVLIIHILSFLIISFFFHTRHLLSAEKITLLFFCTLSPWLLEYDQKCNMILTPKCTSPVGTTSPPGYSPARAPCCLPPHSFLSSARPVHLPDPQRSADPLTRVKTAESPFSPSETSSHQQALHVRRCLFSWVTELSPILPLLWKRSCLVTETHEEHFASSLSSIGSNSCCFGTGCLLNANAKEVRNQFLCFKWFQVRPHLCSNAPRKNKTADPIQQEVFTTKYQLQLRTELWFLYSYNKLVVRDEKHRRLQRRFSAEHAYPHIHTLIYIRALPLVLQLSAACQGKKIY